MKQYRKIFGLAAVAGAMAMAGCGKQASMASPALAPMGAPAAPMAAAQSGSATILGAVKDADWYVVVSAPGAAKPLVIWSKSKVDCERDVGEFSLKAVDPTSKADPPKAWCMIGSEIRSKLGL